VIDVIKHLHGRLVQAPLTGNIAPIARRKLDLIGLLPYLEVSAGGYGDDHEDRVQLLPIAAQRAAHLVGRPFRGCNIIIVGDTPHDIRCGKLNGARTVAVATGPYSLEALRAHEPDALLPDMSDFDAALAALFGS
jgi:phosphoglycolate phosphatase-like HAD superfamily hydrolase